MSNSNLNNERKTLRITEHESRQHDPLQPHHEYDYAARRQSQRHFSIVTDDPELQRKQYEMIEKILAEFDIEETKDKYRSKPIEYGMLDKEYSYDCEMAGMHVRRRLEHLMGTDVVKLNDHKYMQKLQKNLQEEYEVSLTRREQTLANNERLRLRKLYLEGIIPRPPGEADLYEKKKGKRDQNKGKLKVKVQDPPDSTTGIWPKTEGLKPKPSPEVHARLTPVVPMSADEEEEAAQQATRREKIEDMPEVVEWYTRNEREMPKYYDDEGNPLPVRYEAPIVSDLRHEETVHGLYTVAEKIIL